MKNLALGALFVGAASLTTGCIFVSDDDGGTPPGDTGVISILWNTDPGCPDGATTAELVAQSTTSSEMFTDLFNCDDNSGEIADVPVGTYDVFVNITSDDQSTLFAQSSTEADVAVTAGDVVDVPEFTILTEDAFFGFSWVLTEGGADLACTDVPRANVDCPNGDADCAGIPGGFCDNAAGICRGDAGGIRIDATIVGDTALNSTTFDCADGSGETQPYPLGDYTITFAVLNEADGSLLTTDAIDDSLEVGNEIVDLGEVEFAF